MPERFIKCTLEAEDYSNIETDLNSFTQSVIYKFKNNIIK
jgi:hypothetical protein